MVIPFNDRKFFQQGVNMYVPRMTGAANLRINGITPFSLGLPAVAAATAILIATSWQGAVDTSLAAVAVADSTYGRSIVVAPSGDPGNSCVLDVYGWDYLGQPMVERFTGASGSTSILYGKKAFYRFLKTHIVTAATNAVNYTIGTGTRLGLPYKTDIAWAQEGGLFVNVAKRDVILQTMLSVADAVAGQSSFLQAPFPGFVKNDFVIINGGGSTNPSTLTVKLGGTAITGLSAAGTQNGSAGAITTGTPTTAGYNANNRFIANAVLELVVPAAASAKGATIGVTVTPTQYLPADTTDPGLVTTGDTRGTYESLVVLNGATEIVVGLTPDASYNASGNGGLHGIKQVIA